MAARLGHNQPHCQCPEEGGSGPAPASMYDPVTEWPFVKHAPGECKCSNDLALYRRGEQTLWLCSCCNLPGDRRMVEAAA